ncbi:MAG: flavodoxin family protein [Elusimicrobiota bacterium]
MKILIISGSPKKDGNTETLIRWFSEGAKSKGAEIELVRAANLKLKANGCTSCRLCQKNKEYACAIKDDASDVILKMAAVDVVVMTTPLYFFAMSAQLKVIIDRMFSLYKWDNKAGTMETVMKGKYFILLASAYEDIGLKELEYPFKQTAEYTGMKFESLLVPDAGESGEINKLSGIREKTIELGKKIAEVKG